MTAQLLVIIIVIALYRRFLDRALHPFDLAVRPGMIRLGQAMFNVIRRTDQIETCLAARDAIARRFGKLDPVIGQYRVNLVGHDFEQVFKEFLSRLATYLLHQLCHREFTGSINGCKKIELAFLCSDLCHVDVEVSNRVLLELLSLGLVAIDVRQPGDAMALKAAM